MFFFQIYDQTSPSTLMPFGSFDHLKKCVSLPDKLVRVSDFWNLNDVLPVLFIAVRI